MSVTPSPIGGFAAQFFDNNGVILSGGKIYTYAAGTTTPQASYTSASGTTPHSNPIILDSAGRVPGGEIWLTDGLVYKFVIETATGILLGTYDNITGVNSNFVNYTIQEEVITATAGQTVFNLATINYTPGTNSLTVYIDGVNQYVGDSYLETDSDTVTFTSGVHVGGEVKFTTAIQTSTGSVNASIVAYDPPFIGGVATNVQDKLAQTVSVIDFGADPTGVADSAAAIQAAIDALSNQYEKATGLYFPAGIYKILTPLTVDLTDAASLTFYSDTKATINVQTTAGTYGIEVDYSTGATANFPTFNMTGIALSDITAAATRNGIRTKRVIGSKFTQCEFNYFSKAVTMNDDSNLNTFDTCMWRSNINGWNSTDGIANNNVFLNCQWRYHSGTAVDFTGTGENQIIAGDFEPDNANPVLIASDCSVQNTRFERNIQGEIVRVLSNCDIEMTCHSDGGTQALPAVNLTGKNNKIWLKGSSAASFVTYQSTASGNQIQIGPVQAMVANTSVPVSGPDNGNVIATFGSLQSNTTGEIVEALQDVLAPADLTTWTATNCTVTKTGEEYLIVGTGGTASISYTLTGTYSGLRMLLTTEPQNAGGQPLVSLGAGSAGVSTWPSPGRRRALAALYDYTANPIVNPVISITLADTGVGVACKVWNVRTAADSKTPD
jgi:hypothetical protein